MKKDVRPLFGEELQAMRRLVESEDFETGPEGALTKLDGYQLYKDYIVNHVKLARKLKIVIDTGNGSAGIFAPDLFTALGCEVVGLYIEPDASFPNHVPDPEARQSLVDLQKKVLDEKADFGIAFDADGDRVGFVTEQGEFVDADLVLLLLAKDVLGRYPGKKILYDVKCSQLLEELIPGYGGIPFMHRTGHSPIKETMRKDTDIILAGEVSGHFYFVEDYFRIDDGLFGAVRGLEIFSKVNTVFSALFRDIPKRVRTPEIKLPCADEKKFKIIEQIKKDLSSYRISTIDGARIQVGPKSWGLIRASNTSPYLTIRVEGETEAEVLNIKNILADELEKFPNDVTDRIDRVNVMSLTGKLGWL